MAVQRGSRVVRSIVQAQTRMPRVQAADLQYCIVPYCADYAATRAYHSTARVVQATFLVSISVH